MITRTLLILSIVGLVGDIDEEMLNRCLILKIPAAR